MPARDRYRTLNTVERYVPGTPSWTLIDPMVTPRFAHTATVLPDGTVLVAGGASIGPAPGPGLSSAEIFDARIAQ